jgi:hypothetical protein
MPKNWQRPKFGPHQKVGRVNFGYDPKVSYSVEACY